jgi:hypothetical protein
MRLAWLALALVLPAATLAQPSGQTGADQAIDARLRLVGDTLRGSVARLDDPAFADWSMIREAIGRAQAMLSDLPAAPGQDRALNRARSALSEAHGALEAEAPNRQELARELREAAEAMAALRPGLGTIAPRMP